MTSLIPSNPITHCISGQPAINSKDMALHFQKKHKDVLRDIDRIRSMCPKSFNERNFAPVAYTDAKGEQRPAFLLTRDAFSLLAMGFTGKAAIIWKLKYIEAFNALEREVLQKAVEQGRREALAMRGRMTLACRTQMRCALRYKGMGLATREIGKLMDISHQAVFYMLKDAELAGMEV